MCVLDKPDKDYRVYRPTWKIKVLREPINPSADFPKCMEIDQGENPVYLVSAALPPSKSCPLIWQDTHMKSHQMKAISWQ